MSFRKESDPIGYLLHREFPDYRLLKGLRAVPMTSLSAAVEPEERERRANRLNEIEQREGYLRTLQLTKPQEFQKVLDAEWAKEAAELQRRAEREERERFFNRPHARANFDHWAKMSYWSIDEGIALWFGKEPSVVKWESIIPMTQVSAFAKEFAERREIANRAAAIDQIAQSNLPGFFIAWANRIGPPFPGELTALVEQNGPILDWRAAYEKEYAAHAATLATLADANSKAIPSKPAPEDGAKALGARERNSLLLIIGVLAAEANIDLAEPFKSGDVLAAALATKGVTLNEKTIGNHLKAAGEALDNKKD